MLDKTVSILSPSQLSNGLERLLFIAQLIKTDDEPPYVTEPEMAAFDLILDSYKGISTVHELHKKYSSFRIYQAFNAVQSHFTRQQIDEASYVLMDMYSIYESILDGLKPKVKQEKLDKFRSALDKFRNLVQSRKLDEKYAIALPRLEQMYEQIHDYVKPAQRSSKAVPS